MTLRQYIRQKKLPDDADLNSIPLKHPKTGVRIYIVSTWFAGFWYQRTPGRGDGRVYPCQYYGELLDLQVYTRAKK